MTRVNWQLSTLYRAFRKIIWISLILVFVISIINLYGWIFDISRFENIKPPWEPMKPITAICFIISALTLAILQNTVPALIRRVLSVFFASVICIVSLISIYVYLYSLFSGSESYLTQLSYFGFFLSPFRIMALFTACNFLFIGCILILLSSDNEKVSNIAHLMTIPVFLISYFIIVSYILGIYSATEFEHIPASLYSGIAFCGLGAVILLMRPDNRLLRLLLSHHTAGIITRQLLPSLMILPVIIGWLRIQGERKGMYSSEEGVVLVAVAYAFCFLLLIWLTARSIERIDRKRRSIEDELRESEERFKAISEASPVGIGVVGIEEGIFLYVNPAYEQYMGYDKDELLGKKTPLIYWDIKDREIILKKLQESSYVSNYEVRLKRKDGSSLWTMSSIRPILFMNRPSQLGTFIDITKRKQAEDALRNSEQRLKSHIENSPLAIVEWDNNFIVTQWSIEAEHIFGWEKAEIVGKRIDSINMIFEEDSNIVEKTMERLLGGKEIKLVSENRNYTKTREIRNCIWYNSVLLDEKGHMSSVMSLVEDVTEIRQVEKELRNTKNYLENLINYANAPIIVWNTDNEIKLFNNAFERLTGYSSSEVENKKLDLLFPGYSLEESNVKIKQAQTKNWETIEIPILTKQNEIRTVLWNSANIYDTDNKTILSTIAQGNDITERNKAEQKVIERTKELESLNTQLLKELTERIKIQEALKKSQAQLIDLNATKDKFFNIVAHDLKNPFTSLLGSSELLIENINQLETKSIQDLALILNDAAKSGYAILQNLLDWSRSQTGMLKINPERINLRNLINENISTLQLAAANKEIKIYNEVEKDVFIFVDKNMINTILRNLLSNAVKFTYKSGKVVVTTAMKPDEVIVSVKDTGIGIPEDRLDKLFRIDSKFSMAGTENEQGTGLGLKLSKEFAEKLGGRIWVESIEHKGSEFRFSIPIK